MAIRIAHSKMEHLSTFEAFWNAALDYQKSTGLVWPTFPNADIQKNITEGDHYTIWENEEMNGYFTIQYSDDVIWGKDSGEDAVYIHKMVVNPLLKGRNVAGTTFEWAKEHARHLGKSKLRMDTWGDNQSLIDYYVKVGFKYIKTIWIGEEPELLAHYHNSRLALFENAIKAL